MRPWVCGFAGYGVNRDEDEDEDEDGDGDGEGRFWRRIERKEGRKGSCAAMWWGWDGGGLAGRMSVGEAFFYGNSGGRV